jgi:hypothetical protein
VPRGVHRRTRRQQILESLGNRQRPQPILNTF